MDNIYKCPDCSSKEQKPKYIGGTTKEFIFFCPVCEKEFKVKDEGFGFLPSRVKILKDLYP